MSCDHRVVAGLQASKNLQMTEGSSKVSGAVYMAGQEHLDLLLEAYGMYSHTNPLHTDVWPSMRQLEADVIAMTASLLGGQCICHLCFQTKESCGTESHHTSTTSTSSPHFQVYNHRDSSGKHNLLNIVICKEIFT